MQILSLAHEGTSIQLHTCTFCTVVVNLEIGQPGRILSTVLTVFVISYLTQNHHL